MEEVKPRRSYRSARRRQQAGATRHAILEAARKLFEDRGYAGTTIEAIAEMAGVASITVYATFRNKRAILTRLIHVSLVGDQEPGPLLEREGPQALAREPNQVRQVTMFADAMGEVMERVSPIFEVMRNAAFTEPEITDLLDRLLSQRLTGMRFFVDALLRNGPLRPDLMPDVAAETVWALSSPDLHRLLTRRLGWNRDRYKTWLSETLLATLLSK